MNAKQYLEQLKDEGVTLQAKAAELGWTVLSTDFDTGDVALQCDLNPVARREFQGLREVAIFLDGLELGSAQ